MLMRYSSIIFSILSLFGCTSGPIVGVAEPTQVQNSINQLGVDASAPAPVSGVASADVQPDIPIQVTECGTIP